MTFYINTPKHLSSAFFPFIISDIWECSHIISYSCFKPSKHPSFLYLFFPLQLFNAFSTFYLFFLPSLPHSSEVKVTQSSPALCNPMTLVCMTLLCPLNSPDKSTGVGSHALLQIFPTQGLNHYLHFYNEPLQSLGIFLVASFHSGEITW